MEKEEEEYDSAEIAKNWAELWSDPERAKPVLDLLSKKLNFMKNKGVDGYASTDNS